jgi:hypothetical protein
MRDEMPFPRDQQPIDEGVDGEVALATIEPRGGVVEAHQRAQPE